MAYYDMHSDFTPAEKEWSFRGFVITIVLLLAAIVIPIGVFMAPVLF